jgi:hypothetical protein
MKPVDVGNPTPAAQRYGLFQAATGPLDLPTHAIGGGVQYVDPGTLIGEGLDVACAVRNIGFVEGCGDWITGMPFLVLASMNTGMVGTSPAELESRLLERLYLGEQAVVERVFSLGLVGQANSLSNNATAPTALTAAATIQRAIGQLDGWLASVTSRRGIIHAPAEVSSYATSDCGIYREGGRYYTQMGNVVSFGNYAGYTPLGAAPAAGHTTLYACESTTVWRTPDSSIMMTTTNSMKDNQQYALAYREYVVTHNNVFASIDATIA